MVSLQIQWIFFNLISTQQDNRGPQVLENIVTCNSDGLHENYFEITSRENYINDWKVLR